MKRRALLSVSDKTGIIELAHALVSHDIELISTGGTKTTLQQAGFNVFGIEEITGFSEMLDGRVKTLHPNVHGGLLYQRHNPEHVKQVENAQIHAIDFVIVNLYPFQQTIAKPDCTIEEAIENIDIGGPSMLRSAAKNHQDVTVICDPLDYPSLIEMLDRLNETTLEYRQSKAAKVFRLCASYDAIIAKYLTQAVNEENPERLTETFVLKQNLRYGENPHQKAQFYATVFPEADSIASCTQLHGKELSYNNIQDGAAALQILSEFNEPCVVALKHMNPCGVGISDTIYSSWRKAFEADPTSIFGGIVAFNRELTLDIAKELGDIFLEIILAPSFTEEALNHLMKKKNIRVLRINDQTNTEYKETFTRISGGLLKQDTDKTSSRVENWVVPTERKVDQSYINDALFGEKVVKHVKSNAIVIVKDGQTVGVGAGQMNRIGSAEIALKQAGDKAKGAVLASDAFFPMNDTVRLAAQYGITCIIQPGGSIKDQESIDACDEAGIAMIFTGERHFKH
jgi:phosphoribosylaminoimidazolecarboxamide formyltransferase/IMP cyclohydrolase